MFFAMHQHESAIGRHVSPQSWIAPPTSVSTLSLWVVPEHQLWTPHFIQLALVICFTYVKCFYICKICFTYGNVHVSGLFSQPT